MHKYLWGKADTAYQRVVLPVANRKSQKFNYVFNTLDLPDLYDELESLFRDGDEKSSIHSEQLIT